jgi:serine/threonine-protein kinase RsbW
VTVGASLELSFESRLEQVSLAGAAIRAMCEVRGADAEAAGAVELAAVEIATNVVEHAYSGRNDGPIRIRIQFRAERVIVEVLDVGRVVSADRIAHAELPRIVPELTEELPEGGFGLALVRLLADSVEVRREKGWNVLRFTRRLVREAVTP